MRRAAVVPISVTEEVDLVVRQEAVVAVEAEVVVVQEAGILRAGIVAAITIAVRSTLGTVLILGTIVLPLQPITRVRKLNESNCSVKTKIDCTDAPFNFFVHMAMQ